MVLACDLVVAATTARFGLPEVSIGGIPSCAGLFRAPQALPLNLARELILTGEPISAHRAHAAGFVNILSEPGQALGDALGLADRICRNAPLSVQGCLAAVNGLTRAADADGWTATREAGARLPGSADLAEGIQAFLEKRPPRWTGRLFPGGAVAVRPRRCPASAKRQVSIDAAALTRHTFTYGVRDISGRISSCSRVSFPHGCTGRSELVMAGGGGKDASCHAGGVRGHP
jgi:hypothetical protein